MKKTPHIVVIGGGTGSFVVASGLSEHLAKLTMLMTMVDDGGSNQTLRDEFGLLPTSGIRQAIVALSENKTLLRELFTYRFHQGGNGLNGMTFGNLFMAAMADITGSQKKAIRATCELLQVNGQILPISYDDVRLVATYEDGSQVTGEHAIDEPEHDGKLAITNLETKPTAQLNPEAKQALLEADLIILGPGDFYTNTVANLVVQGLPETLRQASAKIAFVTNLMTKYGEAYDYTLQNFLTDLKKYLPLQEIDYLLVNSNQKYPSRALKAYQKEQSKPVKDNLTARYVTKNPELKKVKIIRTDLLSKTLPKKTKGDQLKRSMVRHDPTLLANEIMKLVK